MARLAPVLALALVLAPPAQAAFKTFGADLSAHPTKQEADPVDSVYWNTRLPGGKVRSPVQGEVAVVRLKGRVRVNGSPPPGFAMFLQTLRPTGDGGVQVIGTTPLDVPYGGKHDRVTTYRLAARDANLCVRRGDYLGLATNGGFGAGYEHGAIVQMFAARAGAAYAAFTGAGGDMNGSTLSGRTHTGRDVLLRTRIATGSDATPFCR